MDKTDFRIINCLIGNSRISASELSKEVNLSISAVTERIRKMEKEGVIEQYSTVVNFKKLGYDVKAYVGVILDSPQCNQALISFCRREPEVLECDYIAGDYDFMLKVRTRSSESLQKLLARLTSLEGVGRTKTHLVLSSNKEIYSPLYLI